MGLRNRQRAQPVSRAAIDIHNRHSFVTYEDWALKGPRLKRRAEQEQKDAEWYMTHKFGDPGWMRKLD